MAMSQGRNVGNPVKASAALEPVVEDAAAVLVPDPDAALEPEGVVLVVVEVDPDASPDVAVAALVGATKLTTTS